MRLEERYITSDYATEYSWAAAALSYATPIVPALIPRLLLRFANPKPAVEGLLFDQVKIECGRGNRLQQLTTARLNGT